MSKNITRRAPQMPLEYEEALKALSACLTIDDAKYWNDKADALAAWARIYHSGEADRKARALKLYAFRHMGQLAAELRPPGLGARGRRGSAPGPITVLKEHGFPQGEAALMRKIARLPQAEFDKAVARPTPPSPSALLPLSSTVNRDWSFLGGMLISARSRMRRVDASGLAKSIEGKGLRTARDLVIEIIEWLDEFERHLPKGK